MPITVSIPTALRKLTDDKPSITVQAKTIGELLDALVRSHLEVRKHLLTDEGKLRNFVRVYVNDEDVHYISGGKEAPLQDGDTVTIVPSIAGGREIEPSTDLTHGHKSTAPDTEPKSSVKSV